MILSKCTSSTVFLLILVFSTLSYSQVTMFEFSNGQKYVMNQDLEGPKTGEQYFLMGYVSDAFLDGSENYYSVSIEEPHSESDCFGLKISGETAARDTVKRVVFYHCKTAVYLRSWGGGDGLLDDCSFIENRDWGIRTGKAGNRDFVISYCFFQDNENGLAMKATENVWVHHNIFNRDTLTALFLTGHAESGPAKHNIIEHNIFTNHSRYGMEIANEADSNYVRYNQFINDKITIYNNSNSNLFLGNHISDCDTAIVINESTGNIFERDTIVNSSFHLVLKNGSDAQFIGTVFDSAKVRLADDASELTVKYFLDVKVVDENENPLEDIVVDVYDKHDNLVSKDTTDAEGKISTQTITAYIKKKNQLSSFSPFRVETNVPGYDPVIVDLNENTSLVIGSPASAIIEKDEYTPKKFALEQNYPNPFNPVTKVSYQLAKNTNVSLRIYDIRGRLIRILVNEYKTAGYKSVYWDGKDKMGYEVASGIYFYTLDAGNFKATKRMVLMR